MDTDLRNLADSIRATEDSISDEICKAFEKLHNKSLSIPEENIVYQVPDNDQIISEPVK